MRKKADVRDDTLLIIEERAKILAEIIRRKKLAEKVEDEAQDNTKS